VTIEAEQAELTKARRAAVGGGIPRPCPDVEAGNPHGTHQWDDGALLIEGAPPLVCDGYRIPKPEEAEHVAPPKPTLGAGYLIDNSDPANPMVVLVLQTEVIRTEVRVPAQAAFNFAPTLAQGLQQAAQQALAAASPQLVTPAAANGLFIPGRTA